MANTNRISGLRPVNGRGQSYVGRTNMYLFVIGDSTAVFVGDLVKLAGSAGTVGLSVNGINVEGMATIAQSAADDVHVGVVVGFLPLQTNLETKHRAASTARIALVADDPNQVFEISESASGTALTATEVGLNANVVVGSGSATTGISGTYLDNGSEVTTAGKDLRLLGLAQKPDNAFGLLARWLVMIDAHQYGNVGTTGI